MGEIKRGQYGWYYAYIDDNGKPSGIKILDDIYDKYVSKKYITEKILDDMLAGKTIKLKVPMSTGEETIEAKIIPYTTKNGKNTKIISINSDRTPDEDVIKANIEKIAFSYWNQGFDYRRPQDELNKLDLARKWKTYAISETILTNKYGIITIYKSRREDNIVVYLEVNPDTDNCRIIDETQYKAIKKSFEEQQIEKQKELELIRQQLAKGRKELLDWGKSIYEHKTYDEILAEIEKISPNLEISSLAASYTLYNRNKAVNTIIESFKDRISYDYGTRINSSNIDDFKNKFLMSLKAAIIHNKLQNTRTNLYKSVKDNGLAQVTDNISIDTTLDLGYFTQFKKIINTKNQDAAIRKICYECYPNETSPDKLQESLLNLLRIYYEFYDFPEKNRKAIAKFIAVNKLSEYYDKIKNFDDVLEVLVDNSQDPKLLKPILSGIAGTSKTSMLKNKNCYFERQVRLKDRLLYKPIELLERLRDCIPEYNMASKVVILANIELNADESFNLQFYTFSGEKDGSDFDGRRTSYLTRLYNMKYPKERIEFEF